LATTAATTATTAARLGPTTTYAANNSLRPSLQRMSNWS
jgi:hypothetical protein